MAIALAAMWLGLPTAAQAQAPDDDLRLDDEPELEPRGPRPITRTLRRPPRPAPLPLPLGEVEPPTIDIITEAGEEAPPKIGASIVLEKEKVVWDPRWRKFQLADWIFTGVSLASTVGGLLIPSNAERWRTRNDFDVAVRNALRLDGFDARFVARDASDITLMLSLNQLLVDTLVVTWWGHDADTVAWEMALMNTETIAFNAGLNMLVSGLASRERPYAAECVGEAQEERRDCRGAKLLQSFYSGHTSTTFAVASATCMHHAMLPLYGGGVADVVPCLTSIALAGATGTLRIVADQHWASDVLVGAAMGTFSGIAVPYFLHYAWGPPEAPEPDAISLRVVPLPTGATLMGVF